MIAFRVFRNDSEVSPVGVEGLDILSAIAIWANREGEFTESGYPEESLDLAVGALHTLSVENQMWPTQCLSVGETIKIYIEESYSVMKLSEM